VPNNHEVWIEIALRCATYRFHHEQWPTRLEIGPSALWALARELSVDRFKGVVRRLEIVVPEGWDDDPLSQYRTNVSGEAGRGSIDELIPKTSETRPITEWAPMRAGSAWRPRHKCLAGTL
jgi:hypothetical protein